MARSARLGIGFPWRLAHRRMWRVDVGRNKGLSIILATQNMGAYS